MAENVMEVEKVNPFAKEAEEDNATRTGVGLRVFTGFTRGKGSIPIKWEAFSSESEPKELEEFLSITKAQKADLLRYAIIGYNDEAYTAASDPIAEHVNKLWEDATENQFRLVVRNMHKSLSVIGKSIEDVVAMVKPGFETADVALKAAKQAK